jgi:uncharacterized protein involved in exopolysaccharide biosynthesis
VANRTIELVSDFNKEQRVSRVRARRIFLEGRVAHSRAELDAAEARLRQFNEQNRSWRASPGLVFEEQRLQREVERTIEHYVELARQLEMTLLEEVNDAPRISIVDVGVPPRKAEWPRFWILLASTLTSGLFIGFLIAGAAAVFSDWRSRNPASASYFRGTVQSVKREIRNAFNRSARTT